MKVATWNVNSIRARLNNLYAWLKTHQPDVVCIQESKCVDQLFPWKELRLLNYHSVYFGQPKYNGVAILSKHPISSVYKGFTNLGPHEDEQARLISAKVLDTRIISAYVPNGHAVGSDKFAYKLKWLKRLREEYLDTLHSPEERLLLCGDFNVAPEDEDVWDSDVWHNSIITHHSVRNALTHVLDFGLQDTFRHLYPERTQRYSWWDYSRSGFSSNKGVRIDFIFATQPLIDSCQDVVIDTEERAQTKPSDHAPIIATFE